MKDNVTILAPETKQLVLQDNINVYRCWQAGNDGTLDELEKMIERLKLEFIVVQFNYSLFNFDNLSNFIVAQREHGRTVVLMMHATTDPDTAPYNKLKTLVPVLKNASRLLVHSYHDLNRLKLYGLVDNVAIFPHGIIDWKYVPKQQNKSFTVASYGFFLPHKGLLELITSIKILLDRGMNIKLKMINAAYSVPQSANLIKKAKEQIRVLGLSEDIELISDYLSDEESLMYLSSADLVVFPYQEAVKSSSTAVRYGLASKSLVAVTPLEIFDDVDDAVFKLSGYTPEEMAESIHQIIIEITNNSKSVQQKRVDAKKWYDAHRYSNLGERLGNIFTALYQSEIQKPKFKSKKSALSDD